MGIASVGYCAAHRKLFARCASHFVSPGQQNKKLFTLRTVSVPCNHIGGAYLSEMCRQRQIGSSLLPHTHRHPQNSHIFIITAIIIYQRVYVLPGNEQNKLCLFFFRSRFTNGG